MVQWNSARAETLDVDQGKPLMVQWKSARPETLDVDQGKPLMLLGTLRHLSTSGRFGGRGSGGGQRLTVGSGRRGRHVGSDPHHADSGRGVPGVVMTTEITKSLR
ncbi:hypothetical protein ACJJTC_009280 [Scirpophaga incertulas]